MKNYETPVVNVTKFMQDETVMFDQTSTILDKDHIGNFKIDLAASYNS